MRRWKATLAGLLLVPVLTPRVHAQLGLPAAASPFAPLPGAAASPLGAAPLAAAPAAAGGGRTLWNFLGISKENCAACRQKLCASPLGALLNNAAKPFSALSGGIIPDLCPPVAPGAAGGPAAGGPGGAQDVARKIAADEAAAKARVAAVEYLGTVDCHYWPDAEAALIQSLRTDRNECVRFAAARVMGSGCCCTKNTIAALLIVVTGDDKDDNPAETSDRVRATAYVSLQNCQCRYNAPKPTAPEPPEGPIRPEAPEASRVASGELTLTSYYNEEIRNLPLAELLAEARRVLAQASDVPLGRNALPTGRQNVYDALVKANRVSAAGAGSPKTREPIALSLADDAVPSSTARANPTSIPLPRTPAIPLLTAPPTSIPLPRRVDPSVRPTSVTTVSNPGRRPGPDSAASRDQSLLGVLLSSRRSRVDTQ